MTPVMDSVIIIYLKKEIYIYILNTGKMYDGSQGETELIINNVYMYIATQPTQSSSVRYYNILLLLLIGLSF